MNKTREIKFRVYSEDCKQFFYWKSDNPTDWFWIHYNNHEQYTGLKDKNGKEIYEGDILSGCNGFINGMDWKTKPIEIKYSDASFNVPLWGTEEKQNSTHWLEIIGNIHEKEL